MDKKNLIVWVLALLIAVPATAQRKTFEGELEYNVAVTCDKTFRKLYTWLRNGEFKTTIVRRGEDELAEETFMGTTSLVLKGKNEMYIWSNLLKKGYKVEYKAYMEKVEQLNQFSETVKNATGKTKEILGYMCKEYVATATQTVDLFGVQMRVVTERDYWVCEDFTEGYMGTTPVEGLFFSNEETSRINLPMLGEGVQHYTAEITSIKPRTVGDDEMAVPSDIKFESNIDPSKAQQRLAKEIRKYKKKHKIEDDGMKEKGVYQEKGEWDF